MVDSLNVTDYWPNKARKFSEEFKESMNDISR